MVGGRQGAGVGGAANVPVLIVAANRIGARLKHSYHI